MFRSHVSDGELLALKHGAPPVWVKLRAHAHLKICRDCRKRRDALEFLARSWLDGRDRDLKGFPLEVEDARERFLLRVSGPVAGLAPVKPLRLALTAAAMCAAVAAGVGVWSKVRNPSVMPLPVAPYHAIAKAPARPKRKTIETRHPDPPKKLARPIATPVSRPPILETELAIFWILHREGICLRGSVEVSRASSGGLLVQGVLESPEERNAVESQVRLAATGVPVQIDLRVAGETAFAATAPVISEPATTVVASRHLLPGEELVRAYLVNQKTPPERLEAEVNRIANQSVRISGDLWAESWALRRLQEQFSAEHLAPFSRNQLNRMIADHLAALTSKLEEIRSVLGGPIGITPGMIERHDSSDGLREVSKFAASVQDCFAGSGVSECRSSLRDLFVESSAAIERRRARAELAVIH